MKRSIRLIRWGLGLISVCLLVWMTWFFGYTYVRMVAHPENAAPSQPSATNQEEQAEATLTLSNLEFWTCQIGVFQSEDNAREEKTRLKQLGWEPQIVSKNPFILGMGLAHSAEELIVIREYLKQAGIVSVPKRFQIPERAYRIRGNGAEQTAHILEAVHSFLKTPLNTRADLLSSFEKELAVPIPKELAKLQEAGMSVIKSERTLQEDTRPIPMLRLYSEYQAALEALKK